MSQSLLIISRQSPWSGPSAREALDIALPMFGVDDLYVSARSLRERGLAEERLALAVEVLDDQALRDLLQRYDQVITL